MLSVLKSRDPFHGALQVPAPFKEMLTSIKSILQHARRKLKRPFLVQVMISMMLQHCIASPQPNDS